MKNNNKSLPTNFEITPEFLLALSAQISDKPELRNILLNALSPKNPEKVAALRAYLKKYRAKKADQALQLLLNNLHDAPIKSIAQTVHSLVKNNQPVDEKLRAEYYSRNPIAAARAFGENTNEKQLEYVVKNIKTVSTQKLTTSLQTTDSTHPKYNIVKLELFYRKNPRFRAILNDPENATNQKIMAGIRCLKKNDLPVPAEMQRARDKFKLKSANQRTNTR